MYCNKENVNILTAQLIAYGVRDIIVCPGSRNAPLVHNFSLCQTEAFRCHPVTDERSAGFMALGLALDTKTPVAVCVTSGSALLNLLPAVAEATYQQRGIIVISADRPQQWIGQLDGQTLPQQGALGEFVAKSVTLPEPTNDEERWWCRRLINEALLSHLSADRPSIHINVPISEPLFDFSIPQLPEPWLVELIHRNDTVLQHEVLSWFASVERPLIVIGQLPRHAFSREAISRLKQHYVVLTEPFAADAECSYIEDKMIAIEPETDKYLPDAILYIGGNTIGKRLRRFLRKAGQNGAMVVMVNNNGNLEDVTQHARYVMEIPSSSLADKMLPTLLERTITGAWLSLWNALHTSIADNIQNRLPQYSNALAVAIFEQMVDPDAAIFYANSSSIRLAGKYAHHYCYCNRGLNGIEGSLSTAAGHSLLQPTFCVIGDLSFFYDQNALWQQQLSGNLRILLINDGKGSIFHNLPGLANSPACDTLISAAHTTSAQGICQQFDIAYRQVSNAQELADTIHWLCTAESTRPMLVEVMV